MGIVVEFGLTLVWRIVPPVKSHGAAQASNGRSKAVLFKDMEIAATGVLHA